MSRRLSGLRASEQLKIYARYAKGRSSANHAVSISVVDGVRYLYDNAFTKIKKEFSIEALAFQMANISYCFMFGICEVSSNISVIVGVYPHELYVFKQQK